ncbi:MAG TPA: DNA polymerase III subunit beta, partial [Candidatus Limnocylindria bacterium]|nr:DNA polymerase III subunit beta [Candidatus Limnocylindria bacterium]
MKIICTQENLKSGLATVGRIISSTNTLPILNNLLIKTENGLLKISSTNLEIAITTTVRCKIEEDGGVTVTSKTLVDLVNNLPNKNITFQTKENELLIETENYHTSVKTLPMEEFPLIPTVEGKNTLNLDSQELKKALDQVVFAASTNQTQPEMSGILFSKSSGELRVAATDRYRLAERKMVLPQDQQNP